MLARFVASDAMRALDGKLAVIVGETSGIGASTVEREVEVLMERAGHRFGRLDVLVVSAGDSGSTAGRPTTVPKADRVALARALARGACTRDL